MTSGHTRGSRSSTLVSSTSRSSAPSPARRRRRAASRPAGAARWRGPPGPDRRRRRRRREVTIGGCGPQPVASVVRSAAPVGVHSSIAGAPSGPAYDGTPTSSCATAGGGTGSVPWAPRTDPEPTATGLTTTSSGPRCDDPGADADDVGDRVQRPDLVEVHVHRRDAVHGGLGHGEALEGPQREVADRLVQRRLEEQRADVAPGPVVDRVVDLDVAPGRGEAAARHGSTRRATGSGLTASTASCRTPRRALRPRAARRGACRRSRRRTRRPRRLMRRAPSGGRPAPRRPPRRTRCRC